MQVLEEMQSSTNYAGLFLLSFRDFYHMKNSIFIYFLKILLKNHFRFIKTFKFNTTKPNEMFKVFTILSRINCIPNGLLVVLFSLNVLNLKKKS
uniref:Uncharacterized protein orf93 n=1 Tax=Pyramimonas parkeae TaxID=36894 RepID=C0JWY6_9CHLO|nr:hypothetical protein BK024_pgp094 [Pyramimonas parkeae]ACJ71148.1 hypothetical protein [Pyramimonas parkeae]